jgi:hypothetical protein
LLSYSPQTGAQRKEKSTLTSSNGGSRITKEQRESHDELEDMSYLFFIF